MRVLILTLSIFSVVSCTNHRDNPYDFAPHVADVLNAGDFERAKEISGPLFEEEWMKECKARAGLGEVTFASCKKGGYSDLKMFVEGIHDTGMQCSGGLVKVFPSGTAARGAFLCGSVSSWIDFRPGPDGWRLYGGTFPPTELGMAVAKRMMAQAVGK